LLIPVRTDQYLKLTAGKTDRPKNLKVPSPGSEPVTAWLGGDASTPNLFTTEEFSAALFPDLPRIT
jgi:hypothetical protein